MTETERREIERFALEAPALLSVMDERGKIIQFEATTRDICSSGAFFLTRKFMPLGTDVKVDLALSFEKEAMLKEKSIHINIAGWVVRTDQNGIALCFYKKYDIIPYNA